MRKIIGLLLILCCVLCSKGIAAVLQMLKNIGDAIWVIIKAGAVLLLQFPNELGVSDWLTVRVLYIAVAVWCVFVAGYVFSKKEKKIVWGVISSLVGLISGVLAFA